jgi:acyl carrier protein
VEQILGQIWQELLRVERVGRTDNFFELGGHSLVGMKMIGKVQQHLGVRLPVAAVFQNPTVQQIAKTVVSLQPLQDELRHSEAIEFERGVL